MTKQFVSVVTLVAFIIFSISSCRVYSTREERSTKAASWGGKRVQILAVLTTSGEKIEFPDGYPARLSPLKDAIHGIRIGFTLTIDRANIKLIEYNKKTKTHHITTKDGKSYYGILREFAGDKMVIYEFENISIPLSEVELAWIKKVNPATSFLATLGAVAGTLGIFTLIILLTKESCPFIYSFNGEEYIFDAEPYGGATCEALKRTEWCGLEHLKEINGQYKVKITNEVDETQYTDELKLVVIDHPKGVKVVPDESGEIYTVSQPFIPIHATDKKGRDLLAYFSEDDWVFWQTRTEEKDPDSKADLKDELIFEFPKPEGAAKAKLLFNGCNTLWGSQMVKRFLELRGSSLPDFYKEISEFGPAYSWLAYWNLKEEFYRLHIRVETENGWQSRGTIAGGGPFVSEDRIYIVDIRDVKGDTLKIKLTPPAAIWKLNYLAVDYTEERPIAIHEINAAEALDDRGQDVREILAKTDNDYLVMPNIGDYAELAFEAPVQRADGDRSVFLKASGYYDIHIDAKGEPQLELLRKFIIEPGSSIQYSLEEYFKWIKEIQKGIGQR